MPLFQDRADAGQQLAENLIAYRSRSDVVVLGLPRGGVPVAYEVAQRLHAPLDVFLVHKLELPGHEALAMGAIASGGVRMLNKEVIDSLRIPTDVIDAVAAREQQELERRERVYRDERPALPIHDQTVILIDDGLATNASMVAAVAALRAQAPAQLVVAVPIAAPEACAGFSNKVDQIICLEQPQPFFSVGLWYSDFAQVRDDELQELLARANGA